MEARDNTRRTANESGEYRTGTYATGTARETGGQRMARPSDAETDVRRRVYTEPPVIDWREQRSMDMGQTRSILGR